MKNIIKYAIALVAAGAVIASCDINKPDIFDDDNAFVAFDKGTMSITEAAGAKLSIPVTLASVAGIEESVSFKVVDGTAVAGTNFELLTVSGVLNFDAENRTQYIEFEILPDGDYTGDITFSVEFVNTGSVQAGAENKCTVTILDSDHPLAALLGTYTFSGTSYYDGETSWTATFRSDPSDDNRIWIMNLPALSNGFDTACEYYATADDDLTTLTIPFGQTAMGLNEDNEMTEVTYSGASIYLYGSFIEGQDLMYTDVGSMEVTIVKDGEGNVTGLDLGSDYGFYCEIDGFGALNLILPGITATKD